MKVQSHLSTSVSKDGTTVQSPIRVCMHLRETVDSRVMREAATLVEEGFAVSVVDIEPESTCSIEESIGGVHLKRIVKPQWRTPTRMPWRLLRSAEKLISTTLTIIRMPADIYHAHEVNALPACYIAAMMRRKPLIFDAHELPLHELDHTRWRRLGKLAIRLLTAITSRCSGVITVSPPIAQEMRNRYGISHVTLIRNTPMYQAVQKSERLRQHLGLGPEVRIALYQGNIQSDRRLDRLVQAAAYLEQDIIIVLMGEGFRETTSELEALAVKEGVTDRIKIIPPVPYTELLDWTASADIGLIIYSPDHSLNVRMCLPNKLFEYLMAGLPVLASPLDAVSDLIKTYDIGQIVPSLAPSAIGSTINSMMADTLARERMRRNALIAAQQDLCWEKERQQLISLYHRILGMDDAADRGRNK